VLHSMYRSTDMTQHVPVSAAMPRTYLLCTRPTAHATYRPHQLCGHLGRINPALPSYSHKRDAAALLSQPARPKATTHAPAPACAMLWHNTCPRQQHVHCVLNPDAHIAHFRSHIQEQQTTHTHTHIYPQKHSLQPTITRTISRQQDSGCT